MENKYPLFCYRCEETCSAKVDWLEKKKERDRWVGHSLVGCRLKTVGIQILEILWTEGYKIWWLPRASANLRSTTTNAAGSQNLHSEMSQHHGEKMVILIFLSGPANLTQPEAFQTCFFHHPEVSGHLSDLSPSIMPCPRLLPVLLQMSSHSPVTKPGHS